jgi:putative membrane protein
VDKERNPVLHRPYINIILFNIFLIDSKKRKSGEIMTGLLIDWYPWVKSLHVISVIAWMAGLFYLPRLYVYHAERTDVTGLGPVLEVMERRLLKAIMNPAMIATWVFGLALVMTPGIVDWSAVWPWVKAASVIGMTAFHMWLAGRRKDFAAGLNTRSGRQYRIMNEVPTVLLLLIVFAVIVKF